MNTKKLKDKLLDKWLSKIVCFVLAVIIYFFHQFSVLERRVFSIPLTVVEDGKMTTTADFNVKRYVKVTVRGKAESLNNITESDFVAYIDISNQTKEGKYQVPVLIQPSERLALLEPLELSTSPEKVNVTLEENIFRYVNVSASIAGKPAYGYEVSGITVKPSTVRVSGSRSMVQSLDYVQTDRVEIDGYTESTVQTVDIISNNKKITIEEKNPLDVTVSITPIQLQKTMNSIDVVYSNLNDSVDIISSRAKVNLELEGPQIAMDRITARNIIASADCSSITQGGTYTIPVYIIAPSSVKVISQSAKTITVTAINKQKEEEFVEEIIDEVLEELDIHEL